MALSGSRQDPLDLAVVGAGPAGSVCACSALAAHGDLRVALIDREIFPRDKPCGDAVRDDAVAVLRELGLNYIFSGGPRIDRFEMTVPKKFRYMEKVIGPELLWPYHVIERKSFDNAIYRTAIDRGAHNLAGHALADAIFDENSLLWTLTLKGRSGARLSLQAKALVGADGASSRVRRIVGLDSTATKYSMAVGVRAYASAHGIDKGALRFDYREHIMPGYGWVFPLLDDKVNIGIALDKRDYKSRGKTLSSHLEDYIRYLASLDIVIEDVLGIRAHPLPLAWPELPLTPHRHAALIGDAAAMIDPFTGEGIHFGIWAGNKLGRSVAEGLQQHDLQGGMEDYTKAYTDKFAEVMAKSQGLRTMVRFQRIML